MKKIIKPVILLGTIIIGLFNLALAQKLSQPEFLGTFTAGEDPSEFLLHRVMEHSQERLIDNPEGKLIIRICSSDDFSTAFVKAPLSPLAASAYNKLRGEIIVPYEKTFIANSSQCQKGKEYVFNEYWFVPGGSNLEAKEMFPVNRISHKSFYSDSYDYTSNGENEKNIRLLNKEFEESIREFIAELKKDSKTEGFIVHNSRSKRMRLNIAKV